MKLPLLQLFAQMMPVLQAREALHEMTVIAMGTPGAVKKTEAARIRNEWMRMANVVRSFDPAAVPPEFARARIAALGFTVSE